MPDPVRLLRKLRGRSAAELRERAAQALSIRGERLGWSPDLKLPRPSTIVEDRVSAVQLLERFRSPAAPVLLPGFADPARTTEVLRQRWPEDEARTLGAAGQIREGRFDLLGYQDLRFGASPDWHLDPVAGKRAPEAHWSRIPFLDAEIIGDHKVIWELSRHQYFATLGKAYWYTGDEGWAALWAEHLRSWMDANPPKQGVHWASSLELAFRAISWTWALHWFRRSPHLTPELYERTLGQLYLHGRHIERYLSTYFSPNTHLTGEALGLFYLGTVFPELRRARRWREMGLKILTEQLGVQVYDDGVYFEQATYYGRYTADFYLHLLLLARAHGVAVNPAVETRVQALLDQLMYLTQPDGSTPLLGDDDGGRLLPLDAQQPNDFRDTLAVAAAMFGRSDYRRVAGEPAEATLWLLGPEGPDAWDALEPAEPRRTSVAFPQGGRWVMRDGWGSDANYLLVDCGPHGTQNCGHAHADALAVVIATRGKPVLVDPGTYTYTAFPELRDRFRSSLAHNTLVVDGESSSVPHGPFQWSHIARCSVQRWMSAERFDFFEGMHDGYTRLPDPAVHTRSILFIRGEYWVLRDRVAAAGTHRLELRFHFAPEYQIAEVPGGVAARDHGGSEALRILTWGAEKLCLDAVPFSPMYGALEDARAAAFLARGSGDQELFSVLLPGGGRETVQERDASGGRLLVLAKGEREDWIGVRSGEADLLAGPLRSDFAWTWLRLATDGTPTEIIALDGSRLEWERAELLRAEGPVGHVAARLHDGEWRVDTDAPDPPAIRGDAAPAGSGR